MEWWLSVMSTVMLLILMLGHKRVGWVNALATAESFPQHFNRTLSDPTNRPVLPSNPIIPPIIYDTTELPKAKGGRKSRQFENVQRRTYHPEIEECPICQGPLRLRPHLNWRKHIQTLTDQLYVSNRGAYCDACQNQHLTYLSIHAQQLSLPNSTYGLDILVKIGYLRDYYRLPYHLIAEQLPSHVQISTRHLSNLYQEYLALLACAQRIDLDKLKDAVKQYGGLIYAVDGLEPEGGQPQLWSVREVLTGTLLAAGWVARVNQGTLFEFLAPIKALNLPLLATLSDKQRALVLALEETWKETPHQFCQAHYLCNAADPLYKTDQQMKTQLRKQVRAAAGATMREAQASVQKKPNRQKDPLVVTGLAAQPPQELDEIRQLAAENRDQALNHEQNQSLDSDGALSENSTSEQLNEQTKPTDTQNMTDQLWTFDTNSLLAGDNHLAVSSDVEVYEHRSSLKIPNSRAVLTPDSGPTVVTQCWQASQSFTGTQAEAIIINIANDDGQDSLSPNQTQSTITADTVTVLREAGPSDYHQPVDKAIDLSSSTDFCSGVQTQSVKPTFDSQRLTNDSQTPPNQLKQNPVLADDKPGAESVLDMVRAKLAKLQ